MILISKRSEPYRPLQAQTRPPIPKRGCGHQISRLAIDRRRLLTAATAVTATGVLPGVKLADAAS
jgi:hypothetical protein